MNKHIHAYVYFLNIYKRKKEKKTEREINKIQK